MGEDKQKYDNLGMYWHKTHKLAEHDGVFGRWQIAIQCAVPVWQAQCGHTVLGVKGTENNFQSVNKIIVLQSPMNLPLQEFSMPREK